MWCGTPNARCWWCGAETRAERDLGQHVARQRIGTIPAGTVAPKDAGGLPQEQCRERGDDGCPVPGRRQQRPRRQGHQARARSWQKGRDQASEISGGLPASDGSPPRRGHAAMEFRNEGRVLRVVTLMLHHAAPRTRCDRELGTSRRPDLGDEADASAAFAAGSNIAPGASRHRRTQPELIPFRQSSASGSSSNSHGAAIGVDR